MVCALDDDLSQIGVANTLGVPSIMRRNEANQGYVPEAGQMAVWTMEAAKETILELIKMHKNKVGIYA